MMMQLNIAVEQYVSALQNCKLSQQQKDILRIIYYSPDSNATAQEISLIINPRNSAPIVASGQIGKIGKKLANYLNITLPTYEDSKPAYFLVIGPYYPNEGKVKTKRIGWEMTKNLIEALRVLKWVDSDPILADDIQLLPTEEPAFIEDVFYKEGKLIQVFVNRYERDQNCRLECLKKYGYSCAACGFNFEHFYGEIAKDFIEVHHLKPLANDGKENLNNPLKDLIPLCSNCHSVVHMKKDNLISLEDLKYLINICK